MVCRVEDRRAEGAAERAPFAPRERHIRGRLVGVPTGPLREGGDDHAGDGSVEVLSTCRSSVDGHLSDEMTPGTRWGRFGLAGRTILVTGASGGLGSVMAKGLAAAGAAVAVTDLDRSGSRPWRARWKRRA
jgi:hypothetical protein